MSVTPPPARLLMWSDYGEIAALPPWDVVGLEVVDQPTFQARSPCRANSPVGSGSINPSSGADSLS